MTTLLLVYCIIHDFLIRRAILNREDHIFVHVCLIVSMLCYAMKKNWIQLVEQLFTLNGMFPMWANYSPWEYESMRSYTGVFQKQSLQWRERKKSVSTNMPKAYTLILERSIGDHNVVLDLTLKKKYIAMLI